MNYLRVMPCIYLRVINSPKSYITFVLCRFRLCILQNSITLEYSWSRQAPKVSYFFFPEKKILKALTHSFSWVAVFFFFRHNFLTVLAKIMGIFYFRQTQTVFTEISRYFFYFRLRSQILAKYDFSFFICNSQFWQKYGGR